MTRETQDGCGVKLSRHFRAHRQGCSYAHHENSDSLVHDLTEEKARSVGVWGETLLHFCARQDAVDSVIKLIEKGADVNATAKKLFNLTPLHFSCIENHILATGILLKNKANPNLKSSNGHTPLYHACKHNTFLADLVVKNGGEITPSCISAAVAVKNQKTLNILKQHSSKVYSRPANATFFSIEKKGKTNHIKTSVSGNIFNLGWIRK